jgi:ADP-ribose pyrophosphatase YjhB (NUDIX family)
MFDSLPDFPLERRWRGQVFPGSVVVAIIQRSTELRYLLIRRNGETYTGQWALVGGKWDFGETLVTAVTREVKEETGLDTTFVALRGLVSERLAPPDQKSPAAHFLIFVCELQAENGVASEQSEGAVAWFSQSEIDALHEQKAIIPSDYLMIQHFAGASGSIPHFEAEMLTILGSDSDQEYPARLIRFERINGLTLTMYDNDSFTKARSFLGQMVTVTMDRPMGSRHPQHGFVYPVNYGFVSGTLAPDGEELDAYVLGVFEPMTEFYGRCLAIIHRLDDDDDKLVVVPEGQQYNSAQIEALVEFQERFFTSVIIEFEDVD